MSNLFFIQIIILISILILLSIDFFGVKNKKTIHKSMIGILSVVIAVFSFIEIEDSFKTYKENIKIEEKKEDKKLNESKNILKKKITQIESDTKKNNIKPNDIKLNEKEKNNTKLVDENSLKKEVVSQIEENNLNQEIILSKKEINRENRIEQKKLEKDIKKAEKIEKINTRINENAQNIKSLLEEINSVKNEIEYKDKSKIKLLKKIEKIKNLCSNIRNLKAPKELVDKYNKYLQMIGNLEFNVVNIENDINNGYYQNLNDRFKSLDECEIYFTQFLYN